jgi:hypothetical protein
MKFSKKIWLSMSSVLLTIIVIIMGMPFKRTDCYGDMFLRYIGLPAWSNGELRFHYTSFICLFLLIVAYILWRKTGNNLLALMRNFEHRILSENIKSLKIENLNGISRIYTLECKLGILIPIIITFVLPGALIQDGGLIEYAFGFPCEFLFIHQGEEGSYQLLNNLFNGNYGINFNILSLFFNIVIYYYAVLLIKYIYINMVKNKLH